MSRTFNDSCLTQICFCSDCICCHSQINHDSLNLNRICSIESNTNVNHKLSSYFNFNETFFRLHSILSLLSLIRRFKRRERRENLSLNIVKSSQRNFPNLTNEEILLALRRIFLITFVYLAIVCLLEAKHKKVHSEIVRRESLSCVLTFLSAVVKQIKGQN